MTNFEKAIQGTINKYSMENESNTPDFILAQFLSSCLRAFNQSVQQRENWYGSVYVRYVGGELIVILMRFVSYAD